MKTVALIFLIYILLKYLGRILAPFLMKKFLRKMGARFQQQTHHQYQDTNNSNQEEGEVTIEQPQTSNKKKTRDVGDYVDFEEVEEE